MKDLLATCVLIGLVVAALVKAQWKTWKWDREDARHDAEEERKRRVEELAERERRILAQVIRLQDRRNRRVS